MAEHTSDPITPGWKRRRRLARLERQITELAGHLNAAHYRFLVLIERYDREDGWSDGGGTLSCAHWLNWKCGIDLGAAREKVRVARALPGLPLIAAAMAAGKLSYSKVRALTRVATATTEAELLMMAEHGTAAHVERIARGFRRALQSVELAREAAQFEGRSVTWFHDDDGSFVLKARLPAEAGEVVAKVMEDATADWWKLRPDKDTAAGATNPAVPTQSQYRADVLVSMAESFLAGKPTPSNDDRHHVVVHVDASTLNEHLPGRCELASGSAIAAETARRLSCDASRVVMVEDERGQVLDVGRRTRTIPPAIKRALQARDKGCRFPGCTHARFVDGHHLQHWADGGATSLSNLVLLCRAHHRAVHEGQVAVLRLDDGALRFVRTDDGSVLDPCPGLRGSVDALRVANASQGIDITPATAVSRWCGESLDLDLAVAGLMQAWARPADIPAAFGRSP